MLIGGFADEGFQKARTLEPPMPEQLGVERRHHDRIEVERAEFVHLLPAHLEKVRGVRIRGRCCRRGIVKSLRAVAARDAVIFYPGKFRKRRRWKVEPDVAIKFPISRITRITFGRAPDLPARIAIARKHRRPMRSETRRVDGATRARIAKDQPMGVDDEPTKVRFVQNRIETGTVSALRKPETSR